MSIMDTVKDMKLVPATYRGKTAALYASALCASGCSYAAKHSQLSQEEHASVLPFS